MTSDFIFAMLAVLFIVAWPIVERYDRRHNEHSDSTRKREGFPHKDSLRAACHNCNKGREAALVVAIGFGWLTSYLQRTKYKKNGF